MRATGERVMVGECVSESTSHQCFSTTDQTTLSQCFSLTSQDAIWGVAADRVPVPWVLPCRMPESERKPLPKHPESVGVVQVGACYVASVGRVRVAGACPLVALAQACEWSRVLAFG
jgi:hypothetical protein